MEALPFIQFCGPNVTFMHNNARPHSAAITRQFLATNNVNVSDWPANSPNLNLIEQVWEKLGQHVSKKSCNTHVNDLSKKSCNTHVNDLSKKSCNTHVNDLAAALQAEWAKTNLVEVH